MNEINEFIEFLQEESKRLSEEITKEASKFKTAYTPFIDKAILEKAENANIIRLLNVPKDKWPLYTEIFNEFAILSKKLEAAPLYSSEKVTILFTFLERNIASHILEAETKAFDQKAINDYKFKTMTSEEAYELIRSEKYGYLLNSPNEELSKEDLLIKEDILTFTESHIFDLTDIVNNHQNIFDHYLNKKDDYTKDDINIILNTLKSMKVSEIIVEYVRIILNRKLEKRLKAQTKIVIKKEVSPVNSPKTKKYLSDKEYKTIKKELASYYDLYNSKLIRPLSYEEMIYCVNLLIKLGESKDTINLFVMNAEKSILSTNPITKYLQYYEKLKYYSEITGDFDTLAEIEEYFKEIFICNDTDYVFWKCNIANLLNKEIDLLSLRSDYEMNEAKKLNF